jgi:NADPH:quinone reductase-like Zn-dependent oxidoreductase
MRAVQFTEYGPPGVVHVAEVEEPHAGPGQVRVAVRASGLSPGETAIRSGALRAIVPTKFPYRTGFDAAGVVDEVGDGVPGVDLGDEVFGMTTMTGRGANADFAVLAHWAPKPAAWSWAEAAGAAGSAETATRVLDRLAVGEGHTLLVQGAAGAVGAVTVQLALARGARVLGTASEHNHAFLRSLGAEPTTYGPGLPQRIHVLAPSGVDAVLDCAGGALPDLVTIAGDAARVVTIAPDFTAATHGVHLSHGAPADDTATATGSQADPLAVHGLTIAVALAAEGRLRIPVAATFPLTEAAAAHELSETRHARGKIVLVNRPGSRQHPSSRAVGARPGSPTPDRKTTAARPDA